MFTGKPKQKYRYDKSIELYKTLLKPSHLFLNSYSKNSHPFESAKGKFLLLPELSPILQFMHSTSLQ